MCTALEQARYGVWEVDAFLLQRSYVEAVQRAGGVVLMLPPDPDAEPDQVLDYRIAVEVGAAVLAAERAADLAPLRVHIETMRTAADFSTYRRADVVFHLGVAEAARSARLVAAMTEVQGQMSELIAHIAHPAPVLARSTEQHVALVAALERRAGWAAAQIAREHVKGTEQVVAGLMP